MNKLLSGFILLFLFNSSFAQSYPYVPLLKETKTTYEIGSAIQWNKDYIVTAKHADFVDNVAYRCPDSCDIMFVKKPTNYFFPKWRDRVPFENVVIVGNNSEFKTILAKGKDLNLATNTLTNMDIDVYMTSSETFGGMSGGPVYGDDGKVIGMLVSTVEVKNQPEGLKNISNNKPISIYVPYSEIKKQWNIFQTK